MKKEIVLSFIIGLLAGAIITAAIFLILKPGNGKGDRKRPDNMPNFENGERPSFKDGERPELPEGMDESQFKEKFKERSKDSNSDTKEE